MKRDDYLFILKALKEMPFNPGRNLLRDYLQGEESESILKHKLNRFANFATLAYTDEELNDLIAKVERKGYIEYVSLPQNKFIRLLQITKKGLEELQNPTRFDEVKSSKINSADKEMFKQFDFFLNLYNDEQKKAIVSPKKVVLCVAGAGSGKTTVLTKRIEFLIKFRGVEPKKILAITFTRKARKEMQDRLDRNGCKGVKVETFNSFCEKFLLRNNDLAYDKQVRMMSYSDKIKIIKNAMQALGLEGEDVLDLYFSKGQRKLKTNEQLFNIFVNDCYFIVDYFKAKGTKVEEFYNDESGRMVYNVCKLIEEAMERRGLRTFMDQLVDTLRVFSKGVIPSYEHVLVDEYQDVNDIQIKFLKRLKWRNLFCVGDPRQAIYGWRGSQVKYILNFAKNYENCEVIQLTKNYRSKKQVVKLINAAIKEMGMVDLEGVQEGKTDIKLLGFDSEMIEYEFVAQRILNIDLPREEIFVLARTNKQLLEISKLFYERGIKHVLKSEDIGKNVEASDGEVTLATVHAIKGLEAKMVFVIGVDTKNFPCKGSEHPVVEMVKVDDYDKEDEEKRLFYVALSRASDFLYLTYTGKRPSTYVKGLEKFFDNLHPDQVQLDKYNVSKTEKGDLFGKLSDWRREVAEKFGVPAYVIFQDRVLEEICAVKPKDKYDLMQISGIGESKLRRFGEQVLEIVNS